jgi:diguanylate cyclase (GGDEF)-like protein
MSSDQLSEAEAANNVFSAQYKKGFRWLHFDAPLEATYRSVTLEEKRLPAIVCNYVGLLIWIAFAIFDIYRLGGLENLTHLDTLSSIVFGARWLALGCLTLSLINLKNGSKHYDRVNMVVFIIVGIAIGVTANIIQAKGSFAMGSAQILIVMAAFLPIGLSFWQSVIAVVIITITAIFTALYIPPQPILHNLELIVMMPIAAMVGTMGGYAREYARREQFLLRGILRLQASTDALTGLANRRTFVNHAQTALKQSMRDACPVLLAIIDIDYFKRYNDHYGHSDGDLALKNVAAVIQQVALRPMDISARVGGEEFAVLLYDTTVSQGAELLESMRKQVVQLGILHAPSEVGVVKISIGLAEFNGQESLDTLYRRADDMLYQAKEHGRNRLWHPQSALLNITIEIDHTSSQA